MDPETLLLAMLAVAEQAHDDPETAEAAMQWLAENAEAEDTANEQTESRRPFDLAEACVPNKSGPGHHDDKTGRPCSAGQKKGESAAGSGAGKSPSHTSKMIEAHESDPHVQGIRTKLADAQQMEQIMNAAAREATTAAEALPAYNKAQALRGEVKQLEAALAHESRRSFVLAFSTPHNEQPALRAEDSGKAYASVRRDNWDKTTDFLGLVSTKAALGDQDVLLDNATGGRAYYQYSTLHTARGDGPEITLHELGHHIEERADVKERTGAFAKARFGDEPFVDMAKADPTAGYKRGEEHGRKDDLAKVFGSEARAYYAGKSYPGGRTEILSMGLEQLYLDPVGMAKADPEYFALVVGIIQGAKS